MDDPQAQQARTRQLPPLQEPSRGDHGPPSDAWSHVRFAGSMRFTRRRDRCSTHATQHTGLEAQRTRHHSRGVVELGFAPSRELLEGEASNHAATFHHRISFLVSATSNQAEQSATAYETSTTDSRRFASSRMAADSCRTMPTNGFHERPWEENERAARCHALHHR